MRPPRAEPITVAVAAVPVLLAAGGTAEYPATGVQPPWRPLLFLYAAAFALQLSRSRPLVASLLSLAVLAVFSLVDPVAATGPNATLFLAMFAFFVLAALNRDTSAVTGAMLGLATIGVVFAQIPDPHPGDVTVVLLLVLAGWAAG